MAEETTTQENGQPQINRTAEDWDPRELEMMRLARARQWRKLEHAGRNLFEKFLADYPDRLPDVIVLPDVGARPLFYLLRPVLEQVAAQRGVPLPKTYFFATVIKNQLPEVTGNKAKLRVNRKVFSRRARQIIDDLRRSGIKKPDIVIFDEQTTDLARTKDQIDLAFGRNLPLYAFVSTERALDNPDKKIRSGLNGIMSIHDLDLDEQGIGVYKDEANVKLLVRKNPASTIQARSKLREAMSQIGQRIADDLVLKPRPDVGH